MKFIPMSFVVSTRGRKTRDGSSTFLGCLSETIITYRSELLISVWLILFSYWQRSRLLSCLVTSQRMFKICCCLMSLLCLWVLRQLVASWLFWSNETQPFPQSRPRPSPPTLTTNPVCSSRWEFGWDFWVFLVVRCDEVDSYVIRSFHQRLKDQRWPKYLPWMSERALKWSWPTDYLMMCQRKLLSNNRGLCQVLN